MFPGTTRRRGGLRAIVFAEPVLDPRTRPSPSRLPALPMPPSPDQDPTARVDSGMHSPRHREGEAQLAPGTIVAGRFRIGSILGFGGMGEVYRADDLKLGQTVALKFLPARLANDAQLLARLHDEVRLGRQVAHPNVCRIYDIVDWEGEHFVAMEYVDGEDLSRLLRRIGRITPDKAVDIARGLAAGLMAAHAKGILHRDLKPANVMIDSGGDARIMDFGIALAAGETDGMVAGTPAYMAPELFSGQPATVRSDLYALGLVMFELFTGKHPRNAENLPQQTRDAGSPAPTPVRVIRDVDPAVERVILRCLNEDPLLRPGSAREVIDALGGDPLAAAIAAGETPSPRVVAAGGTEGTLKPRVAVSLLAATLFFLALLFVWTAVAGLLRKSGLDRPPVVLAEHAAELLRGLGIPGQDSRSFGFDWKKAHFDWIFTRDSSPQRWERGGRGLPLITFWMRETSQPLLDTDVVHTPEPKIGTPPQTEPGEATIEIDPRGRLISLSAIASPQWEPRPLDWTALLAAAGLSNARLTPTAPRMLPPSFADARAAWSGRHPEDGTPIRVEAAAWRGVPSFFRIVASWDEADAGELPFQRSRLSLFITSFVLTAVAIGAVLAWRNLRMQRGDRPGAFRIASMLFVLALVATAARAEHHLALLHELKVVLLALSTALLWAGAYWLVYIGLEPHVRRRWPELLISWTRLTAGSLRDPMVGRDVLIGVAAGLAHVAIASSSSGFSALLSGTALPPLARQIPLLARASLGISHLAASLQEGIVRGLTFMVVLMVLTILFRRRAFAVAGAWLLLFAGFLFASMMMFPVFAIITTLAIFVAARYGLLASAAMQAVYAAMVFYPLPDAAAWYTARGLIAPAVVVAIAIWAFRTSLGGQRLFSTGLLDQED